MTREILHADLLGRNSFGVAATADRIVEFSDAASLRDYLAAHEDIRQGKLGVLGGGNNILFTEDFHGTLLHPAGEGFSVTGSSGNSVSVRAEAGLDWEKFVERCIGLGLWGTENLTAIPGTVGAAPVQNIGAYGAEAQDIIVSVKAVEIATGNVVEILAADCEYGYRQSRFKHEWRDRYLITSVVYRLSRRFSPRLDYGNIRATLTERGIDVPTAHELRQAIIDIRHAKLPDPKVEGNAGSFFMNPIVSQHHFEQLLALYPDMPHYRIDADHVKIPAGWMIDQCGWRGRTVGHVGVHARQALVLVNHGGATGAEVVALYQTIQRDVKDRFGIDIHPEVNVK